MEALAGVSAFLAGVIDITTTEVCDLLIAGGVFAADARTGLARSIRTGECPISASCGALDMVNFNAPETVPERYRDRQPLSTTTRRSR